MSERDRSYEHLLTRLDTMRRRVAEIETRLQQIARDCTHMLQGP